MSNQKDTIKLQFGLKENKVININDLTLSDRGLKCSCVCPSCGEKLSAKLGETNRWHFAHLNAECDIKIAQQTAIHLLAKEIIEEDKVFKFPELSVKVEETKFMDIEYEYYYDTFDVPHELVYRKGIESKLDEVILEKKVSNIIPDILVKTQGKLCLIEIAVTHFIDNEKTEKIKQLKIPTIEIDLSSLKNIDINKQKLRKILNDDRYKKWIFNPLKEKALLWANDEYEKLYKETEIEEVNKEQELHTYFEKKQQRKENRNIKVNNLFMLENYKNELKRLKNDDLALNFCKQKRFYKNTNTIPFFVNIPVEGEMVFKCDRRIWQSEIFDKFIYNRKPQQQTSSGLMFKTMVSYKKVESYLTRHQKYFDVDWSLVGNVSLSYKRVNLLSLAVKQYLYYLAFIGFITEEDWGDHEVLVTYTISPPNRSNSALLQEVFSEVDIFSNSINQDIMSEVMVRIERKKVLEQEEYYKKQTEETYNTGYNEVTKDNKFLIEKANYDSFGYKWFKCRSCHKILREDEMVYYSKGAGLCKVCQKNGKSFI